MQHWFLAILPDEKTSNEIVSFQEELAHSYGFKHALNTPPHITIIPPFFCDFDVVDQFVRQIPLLDLLGEQGSFEIKLDGFQAFHPRVIFVDVEQNSTLMNAAKQLKQLFSMHRIKANKGEKHFFTPHITIANRDLTNKTFKLVYNDFISREYEASFEVSSIFLLKKENKKWSISAEISL